MSWLEYNAIANRAAGKLNEELGPATTGVRRGFSPVVDGVFLPQHPYFPEASPTAAEVPMIICTTFNEQSPSRTDATLEEITLDGVKGKAEREIQRKSR